jgi:hypothetical protein
MALTCENKSKIVLLLETTDAKWFEPIENDNKFGYVWDAKEHFIGD